MGFRIQVEGLVLHRIWGTISSEVARRKTKQKVGKDSSSSR